MSAERLAEGEEPIDLHARRRGRRVRVAVEDDGDDISRAVTAICSVGVGGDEGDYPRGRAPLAANGGRDSGRLDASQRGVAQCGGATHGHDTRAQLQR